ncbi:MAG TPA: glycogen-binding domain-containing protein [Gemmatimonadaceae bacterium]|nr:glycogen-binding domain-containing protein [Gemmatimonadaceae bacterium]
MRRATLPVIGGLLIAVGMGRPLGAQQRSSLDVGVSVVRFLDESTTVAGPSVGWTSTADGRRLFGQLSVGGVGTFDGASGSAALSGGVRTPIVRRWLLEAAGELFGVAGSSARGATTATGSGRIIRVVGDGGIWARGAASIARRESGGLPAQAVEGGLWWSWPRGRVTAVLIDQQAKAQLFSGPTRDRPIGTLPVHYQEGAIGARLEGDAAAVDVTAGVRRDPGALSKYEPTFSITAAFWLTETRAWTVAISRSPPDWVRGADGTQWLAVGMRFYEPRPAIARSGRIRPLLSLGGGGEQHVIRVRAIGAQSVQLMADFTDWTAVTLAPAGDGFETRLAIPSGTHRVLVRVDGGRWRPAANTPAVDDDLGGRVGLLVVP